MARSLAVLLLVGLISLSIYLTYWAGVSQASSRVIFSPLIELPIYVVNRSPRAAPLYHSANPHGAPIGQLPPGGYYTFAFSGESGEWLYGSEFFIKEASRAKALVIGNYTIPLSIVVHSYAIGIFALLLLLRLLFTSQNHPAKTKLALDIAQRERRGRLQAEQQVRELSETNRRLRQDTSHHEAELHSHSIREEQLIAAFRKKELQLRKQFEDDANDLQRQASLHTKIEIGRMQATHDKMLQQYTSLKQDYERLKTEGLAFDLNFDGANYENLLKGRLFEIYVAKHLLTDNHFEILSWTSDKGFENGIKVKSNGDPDFVIQYNGGLIFALECKYRSYFYAKQRPNRVEWGYSWQAERYANYQRDHNIPVFVGIGIEGKADQPNHVYLASLNYLLEFSMDLRWRDDPDNEEQQVINQGDLFNRYINKKGVFSTQALELIKQQLEEDATV